MEKAEQGKADETLVRSVIQQSHRTSITHKSDTTSSVYLSNVCLMVVATTNDFLAAALGQSAPLTLIVALVQFTAPHAYLSTATGLAFSARAIGGAFGSAVLDAIINGKLASIYEPRVSAAAVSAGLPQSSLPALFKALASSEPEATAEVPGMTSVILAEVLNASHWAYSRAYNVAWASVIPFVVLALLSVACLKGVEELMTDHTEASVEKARGNKEESHS
jgi:hypothetical protein